MTPPRALCTTSTMRVVSPFLSPVAQPLPPASLAPPLSVLLKVFVVPAAVPAARHVLILALSAPPGVRLAGVGSLIVPVLLMRKQAWSGVIG